MVVARDFVLYAGQHAQLAFDGDVVLVSVVGNLLGEGDVLFVGEVAAVNHYRRETGLDAALAQLEAVAVVEVQNNLGVLPAKLLGVCYSALGHVAQQGGVGVVAGTF